MLFTNREKQCNIYANHLNMIAFHLLDIICHLNMIQIYAEITIMKIYKYFYSYCDYSWGLIHSVNHPTHRNHMVCTQP